MRSLPHLFALVLLVPVSLVAGDLPTVKTGTAGVLPDLSLAKNAAITTLNLLNHFEVTSITGTSGQVVQMRFVHGPAATTGIVNLELDPVAAPNTVANFLSYVTSGKYTNTVVHRSGRQSASFSASIIQGGSFVAPGMTPAVVNPAIALEYNKSNAIGTIAMARSSDPNSATSGWFFNVTDNTNLYAPGGNTPHGYAAFGRVIGTGMTVVGAINSLAIFDATGLFGGNFGEMPLSGVVGGQYNDWNAVVLSSAGVATVFPSTSGVTVTSSSTTNTLVTTTGVPPEVSAGSRMLGSTIGFITGNFINLNSNADRTITTSTVVPATVSGERNVVTFSIENTNPGLVNASVTGSALEMFLRNNRGGVASLVANATDSNGNVAQIPFRITVTGGNTVPADVNSDTIDDLILQNNSGQVYAWLLNGTGATVDFSSGSGVIAGGARSLYPAALGDWRIAAKADVNSDGVPDIILQNAAGQIYAWSLDGTGNALSLSPVSGLRGWGFLYSAGLGDWKVADVADVNGDGTPDIILQNNVGQVYAWFLDGSGNGVNFTTGAGLKGWNFLYTPGLGDWRLANCADLNGDTKNDLVFQNNLGQLFLWTLDGTGTAVNFSTGAGLVPGTTLLYTSGLGDWRLATCSDVNGDGKNDVVFQNTAGQIYAWLLNGTGVSVDFITQAGLVPGSGFIYPAGLGDWRVR